MQPVTAAPRHSHTSQQHHVVGQLQRAVDPLLPMRLLPPMLAIAIAIVIVIVFPQPEPVMHVLPHGVAASG